MAYRSRGLPSTGCNKCRARRIKCDETKPRCSACIKIGHTDCKFRDEFERTWRLQTDKTVAQTYAKEREPRKSKSSTPEFVQNTAQEFFKSSSPEQKMTPTSPADSPILTRFFYDWSHNTDSHPGSSILWFNVLPEIYANASVNSLVYKAINTLANASYGQRFGDPKAITEAGNWCAATLRLLKDTMASGVEKVPARDVLASIVLLGIYEVVIDYEMYNNGPWLSHMGGAALLSNMRSLKKSMTSPTDLQLSTLIFRQMLFAGLVAARTPVIPIEKAAEVCPSGPPFVQELTDLVYRIALLFSEWKSAFLNPKAKPDVNELIRIATQAMFLDQVFDDWVKTIPDACAYTTAPVLANEDAELLTPLFTGSWVPICSHTYPSSIIQMLWRFYWISRMILNQALLYTSNYLSTNSTLVNPALGSQPMIEARILTFADRLSESCIGAFVNASSIGNIRSLQGYLMLQALPTTSLCLEQSVTYGMRGHDLSGRLEWLGKMKVFFHTHLGFSKGLNYIDPSDYAKLPIQIWGFSEQLK